MTTKGKAAGSVRRGRRLTPDKFFVEEQLAALVYLELRENGGLLRAALTLVADYLGTSVDTVQRAWRTWGRGAQAPQNRSRAGTVHLEYNISPENYAARIKTLRRRLSEIRASRGVPDHR